MRFPHGLAQRIDFLREHACVEQQRQLNEGDLEFQGSDLRDR
jgi:hypothetical protein